MVECFFKIGDTLYLYKVHLVGGDFNHQHVLL